MKSPLRLNVVVALSYVALCTTLVLINQQADIPAQGGPMPLNVPLNMPYSASGPAQ